MSLVAELQVERARFRLSARLTAAPGEVVALLGPNGAGKSTALRALAGLEPLTAGEVRFGEEVLESVSRQIRVPADARAVGMVFQDYLLFPHLSVADNIAFGPRAQGTPKATATALAHDWLGRMGLSEYAEHRPGQLSGGQAQRVALARALAVDPSLLLLDEPLAALDSATRPATRAELGRQLTAYEGSCLLVTHDPLDAMTLADRVVILENGTITQQGIPSEVAREPRTTYAAQLVGLNFSRGYADGEVVHLDDGGALTIADHVHGTVCVVFSPAAVALFPDRPEGSPRNCWKVRVTSLERHGTVVRVHLTGTPAAVADVTTAAVAELAVKPGDELWAAVKATEISTYPA